MRAPTASAGRCLPHRERWPVGSHCCDPGIKRDLGVRRESSKAGSHSYLGISKRRTALTQNGMYVAPLGGGVSQGVASVHMRAFIYTPRAHPPASPSKEGAWHPPSINHVYAIYGAFSTDSYYQHHAGAISMAIVKSAAETLDGEGH